MAHANAVCRWNAAEKASRGLAANRGQDDIVLPMPMTFHCLLALSIGPHMHSGATNCREIADDVKTKTTELASDVSKKWSALRVGERLRAQSLAIETFGKQQLEKVAHQHISTS